MRRPLPPARAERRVNRGSQLWGERLHAAQQAEAAREHHVAVRNRLVRMQRRAAQQLTPWSRDGEEGQRVVCGPSAWFHQPQRAMPTLCEDTLILQRARREVAQIALQLGLCQLAGVMLEEREDPPPAQMKGEGVEVADVRDQTLFARDDRLILQRARTARSI